MGSTATPTRLARLQSLSDLQLLLVVVVVLAPLFFATAQRSFPYNVDALTNVLTADRLASTGSVVLEDSAQLATPEARGVLAWVVPSPRGPVSQYPPGTALVAALPYAIAGEGEVVELSGFNDPDLAPVPVRVPPLWPAALTGALASALAAGLTVLAVRALLGTSWGLIAGGVLAVGTGLWLNGSHLLFQHGVAGMWVALGTYLASRHAWLGSGLAMGAAVLTRPPVAVASAGLGLLAAWRRREWRPVLLHGLGASAGLAALLAYNHWIWGELTISGGYTAVGPAEQAFGERLVSADAWWYAENVLGGLLSPHRGLFVWSPVVLIALLGLRAVWRDLPGWAGGALIGGAMLLLLQFRLNRFSGGSGFFSYRYPIEALVAATPALAVAAKAVWDRGGLSRGLLLGSAAASVAAHTVALVLELTG